MLREPPGPNPADVAAVLMTRLDGLLVELDPSAVMVHGGGMAAAVAAQVAFWRQIPVVHLQAGVASDDLVCPFPQEANRRVIGQLASLFLTTGGAALGSPIGPNAIPVGDTMAATPSGGCVRRARRACGRGGTHSYWSGSTGRSPSASSPGSPSCWSASPTSRSSCSASWPGTARRARWAARARGRGADVPPRSWSGSSRRARSWSPTTPSWSTTRQASACRPCSSTGRTPEPGDPIQSIRARGHGTLRQVLAAARDPARRARPTAGRPRASSRRSPGCSACVRRRRSTDASHQHRRLSPLSWPVLLSDADLRKEVEAGRLALDPRQPAMLRPSSVDVRLDRFFRVFQNSRYTHIDPAQQQDELTTQVEPEGDEPLCSTRGVRAGLDVRVRRPARRPCGAARRKNHLWAVWGC